jgi:hypothetical protein
MAMRTDAALFQDNFWERKYPGGDVQGNITLVRLTVGFLADRHCSNIKLMAFPSTTQKQSLHKCEDERDLCCAWVDIRSCEKRICSGY